MNPFKNGGLWRTTGERMNETDQAKSREELSSTETGILLTQIFEISRAVREQSPIRLDSLAVISETEGNNHAA
jgi:hypothetical protein